MFRVELERTSDNQAPIISIFGEPEFRRVLHFQATLETGSRAEGPTICLAQANGLGIEAMIHREGRRSGRLQARDKSCVEV